MIAIDVTGSVPRFPRREIATFARRVLRRLDVHAADLAIAFVNDDTMVALNRRFRRKNKTTDVLTFPGDEDFGAPASSRPVRGLPARRRQDAGGPAARMAALRTVGHLGDIVISLGQARRQAAGERHSLATEVRYLIVHGILHALGYDHETDNGEMNALELEVRDTVGL